jgi:diguanylate cyclase (GGDEF)-like protein
VGGEEFAVLLPETQSDQALLVTERLRQAVAQTHVPLGDEKSVDMTVSIGIATASPDDCDVDALIKRADQALYEAKRTGRDRVCLAEPLASDS